MKKMLTVLIACGLVLNLVSCSQGNQENSESSANSTSSSVTADESAGNTGDEVVETEAYWFSTVAGFGPANWEEEYSPATQYAKDNFGLTFELEQPPSDADTKLGLLIATNDLPDMITLSNSELIVKLGETGQMWTIEELMQKYVPDSWLLTDFPEDAKQALIDKFGAWYSLPSHLETADNRAVFPPNDEVWLNVAEKGRNGAIMFNTDIMEELGITEEMVQTEEGFYEACEIVKTSGYMVDGQEVIPVLLHGDQWANNLDGIISDTFGVLPVDEDGSYMHKELDSNYKNALNFVNTLVRNGYTDVNTFTIDETAMKTYLTAERVFCWIGNQAQIDKTDTPWVSYGAIYADNGADPTMAINQSAGTGWLQTMVKIDTESEEQIAKFLSWITSYEGLMMNYYGIEGEDYSIDENNIVTKLDTENPFNQMLWSFANTSFERHTEALPDSTSNRGVEIQIMPAFGIDERTYIYDSSLIDFPDNHIEPSSDLGISEAQVISYLESQKAKIATAATEEEFETEYQNMLDTLESYNISEIDDAYDVLYKKYSENLGKTIEDVNAE